MDEAGLSQPNFFNSNSFTCAGLALPLLAFMIGPTKPFKALALPALNSSTFLGLAASTSSMIFSNCACVVHLLEAFGVDEGVDVAFTVPQAFKHLTRCVVADGVVADAANQGRELRGAHRGLLNAQLIRIQTP